MASVERNGGHGGPGAKEPTEETSGFRRVARIWALPNGGHFVIPVEASPVEQTSAAKDEPVEGEAVDDIEPEKED